MSIWCNIFGHKWDTSDKYEQNCMRRGVWFGELYMKEDIRK